MFKVGDKVQVTRKDGKTFEAVIDSPSSSSYWWVRYIDDYGNPDVDPYEEKDIKLISAVYRPKYVCECGSDKANQPGHSSWCGMFNRNKL
jgi:hypothetical protein